VLDDEPARGLRQGADAADPGQLIPREPANRLPEAAKRYWRASLSGMSAVPVVAAVAIFGMVGLLVIPPAIVAVAVVPELRWRRWRYEIREDEIDLQHGLFTVKRTLIPIRRIQHVGSEVSWLQGSFGVATVTFHTAAGGTSIPAIGGLEAETVRQRVAALAKALDDV
jgi:uncharacterized protein